MAGKPTKAPTLNLFFELEKRLTNLLSRQSNIAERQAERTNKEFEQLLSNRLGLPGLSGEDLKAVSMSAASWPMMNSVITEKDVQAIHAKCEDKETGAIKREIEATLSQIKEFCSKVALLSDPKYLRTASLPFQGDYADWFVTMFMKRWRHQGDFVEYQAARNRLVQELAEISAEKQKRAARKVADQRHLETSTRNSRLAEEFLQRRPKSYLNDSRLKQIIGREQKPPLKRSAAIEAIDDGLARRGKR
jgi:hypothetical protein